MGGASVPRRGSPSRDRELGIGASAFNYRSTPIAKRSLARRSPALLSSMPLLGCWLAAMLLLMPATRGQREDAWISGTASFFGDPAVRRRTACESPDSAPYGLPNTVTTMPASRASRDACAMDKRNIPLLAGRRRDRPRALQQVAAGGLMRLRRDHQEAVPLLEHRRHQPLQRAVLTAHEGLRSVHRRAVSGEAGACTGTAPPAVRELASAGGCSSPVYVQTLQPEGQLLLTAGGRKAMRDTASWHAGADSCRRRRCRRLPVHSNFFYLRCIMQVCRINNDTKAAIIVTVGDGCNHNVSWRGGHEPLSLRQPVFTQPAVLRSCACGRLRHPA